MGVLVAALGVFALGVAAADASAGSFVLRAGPSFQRVGNFDITRDPTYRGAIRAFGKASTCRLMAGAGGAVATWADLGVTIRLETLGGLPKGKTGCTAPASIYVDRVFVTGKQWRTARGLRIDDSDARIRRLYRSALYKRRSFWGSNTWWIVHRRQPCAVGICRSAFETVPRLIAKMRRARVAAFIFPVGAQGD